MSRLHVLSIFGVLMAVYIGYNLLSSFDEELLRGKSILITGASSGIGEQLAYKYARLGCRILITARRRTLLEKVGETCMKLGAEQVEIVAFDMARYNAIDDIINEIKLNIGRLDYLILNHGLFYWESWDGNLSQLNYMMDVNFMSFVALTTKMLPFLNASNGGIAVVSSVAGKMGLPYMTHYSATKHALDGFFRSLRHELALSSVDVSITICTMGGIDTDHALQASKHVLSAFWFRTSASDAAEYIVQSSALRSTDVFFPWLDTMLQVCLIDRYFPWSIPYFHI
ncbi:hydroxysteroid 11-beta-dehydrogenase 1-like protein [Saccoglossus kowalevskii]|uniref:Hydroxysteroid 11-beta-dehydrogenase 1-like protein-like n=1 Tax=Saccoglossus kowalevskii TaxID=10224 RepID=A0ABM0GXG9_SACKO|nr:PREDICTED: hydroxysteroid 11-beta-dehydrogenase 1-like protein-like [Saccoglossus kowalevskii]